MLLQLSKKELNKKEFQVGLLNGDYYLLTMDSHHIAPLKNLPEQQIELKWGVGGGCYLFRSGQGVLGVIKNYSPIDFLPVLSKMSFNEGWKSKDIKQIAKRLNQPHEHVARVIRSHKWTLTEA